MDTVIKYLYGGEIHIDKDVNLRLEAYVQLWIHADFLQLGRLRIRAVESPRASFIDTARWLWTYNVQPLGHRTTLRVSVDSWIQSHVASFKEDLLRAVKVSYTNPAARKLHKTLATCIYSLGDCFYSVEQILGSLELVPELKSDMLNILVRMRFDPELDGGFVAEYVSEVVRGVPGSSCKRCRCTLATESENKMEVTGDPFSPGKVRVVC